MPKGGKSTTPRPVEDRFWEKVDAFGDCWEWIAGDDGKGYGAFHVSGDIKIRAHVFAWEILVGPVPVGKVLDHLCRNRRCVNPDHLEVVTQKVNTLRGYGPSALAAARNHCVRGHLYNEENTIIKPCGKRCCRICQRIWSRDYYLRQQAKRGWDAEGAALADVVAARLTTRRVA